MNYNPFACFGLKETTARAITSAFQPMRIGFSLVGFDLTDRSHFENYCAYFVCVCIVYSLLSLSPFLSLSLSLCM